MVSVNRRGRLSSRGGIQIDRRLRFILIMLLLNVNTRVQVGSGAGAVTACSDVVVVVVAVARVVARGVVTVNSLHRRC